MIWLELSTLARWCEAQGKCMSLSANTCGVGSFTNGVDLVPTRDDLQITGARFYVPVNLGLSGKVLRLSLWDNLTNTRINYTDFTVPLDGQRYDVMFNAIYNCEAYRNICISVHDTTSASPKWWLLDNNIIRTSIVGSQPYILPGSLTQVAINSGMWRCGPYFIAGDGNPCGLAGTYMAPSGLPNDRISTVDPILV